MGKEIEQTFTDNCQHVAMIDSIQYQETNFEEEEKLNLTIRFYISPSLPGIVTP